MEVALDLALQCAPDHPWATEHPEWFTTRVDGTIAYAENPPKKYQDIYPLNFDNDPEGLYAEVLRVVRLWVSHGVKIFRVDNPHTKPLDFWEWLIAQVKATDPDVLFLAEAFTRPAMMHSSAASASPSPTRTSPGAPARTSCRSTPSSWSPPATTCGRTSSSTPRTSCTRRCSTAARRCSRSGRCWPRCCRPVLRRLRRLRAVRARRGAAGQRGVPRLGEVPAAPARLEHAGAHAGAVPHDAQPGPPGAPGDAPAAQPGLPRGRLPRRALLEQAPGAGRRHLRRGAGRAQPRPARRPRGDRAARPAGPRAGLGPARSGSATR